MTEAIPSPRTGEKHSGVGAIFLLPILTVAASLRIYMLAARGFWIDEGVSVALARLPWHSFQIVVTRREGNMTLYYLLLRAWLRSGSSEAWIRSLSVIAAVGAVSGVFFLGRKIFGMNVACIAAGILALNAYHVQYSQEARSYALLSLAVIVTTFLLLRCVEKPTWQAWALFAIVSGLAAYIHFFAIFVTASQVVAVLLWRRRALKIGSLVFAATIYALMLVPIAQFVLENLHMHQIDWIPAASASSMYEFAVLFTGRGGVALVLTMASFIAAAIVATGRDWFSSNSRYESFALGVVLLWLFFPMAITIALSLWKHLFVPRYMVMCLPALALAVARGVALLRPKWQIIPLIALAILLGLGDRNNYATMIETGEDWQGVAQFVVQHAQPGDAIIFNNGIAHPVFDYYMQRTEGAVKPRVIFPLHNPELPFLDFEGLPNALMFPHITEGVFRVWLVDWTPVPSAAPLLDRYFTRTQSDDFLHARVSLYIPRVTISSDSH
jgi:mannosyltransferase